MNSIKQFRDLNKDSTQIACLAVSRSILYTWISSVFVWGYARVILSNLSNTSNNMKISSFWKQTRLQYCHYREPVLNILLLRVLISSPTQGYCVEVSESFLSSWKSLSYIWCRCFCYLVKRVRKKNLRSSVNMDVCYDSISETVSLRNRMG